ncbi:MAG: hypothetical protein R2844_18655 [Caldilineales bacterium]
MDLAQQTAWLDSADPAAAGRAYAERILAYDFGMATEKANGRLLIDAWMSLNESLPGPGTFPAASRTPYGSAVRSPTTSSRSPFVRR